MAHVRPHPYPAARGLAGHARGPLRLRARADRFLRPQPHPGRAAARRSLHELGKVAGGQGPHPARPPRAASAAGSPAGRLSQQPNGPAATYPAQLLLVTVVFWRGVLSELTGPPGRTPRGAADAGWAMATAQTSARGMVAASAGHLRRICAPFSYRACRDKHKRLSTTENGE